MSEAEIEAVMGAAMDAENRRRDLAGQSPGLGALLSLPQSPNAAAVGKSSLDMPAVGEGLAPVPHAFQYKAYGPDVPVYADPVAAGRDYAPGDVQGAVRSLAARVFARQDAAAAGGVVDVVSPDFAPPRRGLLGRVLGRLRRR